MIFPQLENLLFLIKLLFRLL